MPIPCRKRLEKFAIESSRGFNDFLSNCTFIDHLTGLQTSQDARFYALSNKFTPFTNKDKPLVIQFSVKHEQNIDCGGGYLKIFDCKLDQKDMHGESPYEIMFGPDICGPGTKKVSCMNTFALLIHRKCTTSGRITIEKCFPSLFSHAACDKNNLTDKYFSIFSTHRFMSSSATRERTI